MSAGTASARGFTSLTGKAIRLSRRWASPRPRIGVDLVTVYRWRKALLDGRGISDANKRKLVEATAGTEHAIAYADFFESEPGSPQAASVAS